MSIPAFFNARSGTRVRELRRRSRRRACLAAAACPRAAALTCALTSNRPTVLVTAERRIIHPRRSMSEHALVERPPVDRGGAVAGPDGDASGSTLALPSRAAATLGVPHAHRETRAAPLLSPPTPPSAPPSGALSSVSRPRSLPNVGKLGHRGARSMSGMVLSKTTASEVILR